MLDAGERNVAPARRMVLRIDSYNACVEGLEVDLADEPLLGQFADRLSGARIDSGERLSPAAVVTPSSHACASTLRAKWQACSLPALSRYRARHVPLGRFWMLAM